VKKLKKSEIFFVVTTTGDWGDTPDAEALEASREGAGMGAEGENGGY